MRSYNELLERLRNSRLLDITFVGALSVERNHTRVIRVVDRNPIFLHLSRGLLEFSQEGDSLGPILKWRELKNIEFPEPVYEDSGLHEDFSFVTYSVFELITSDDESHGVPIRSGQLAVDDATHSERVLRIVLANGKSLTLTPYSLEGVQLLVSDQRPIEEFVGAQGILIHEI